MDSKQFLNGYQDISNREAWHKEPAEVKEIMTGPRKWASFFDTQLHDILSGQYQDDDEETANQFIAYELDWAETQLDPLVKQSQDLAFSNAHADVAVNELNFHILNKELVDMWHRAMNPEKFPRISVERIETMQSRLAQRGASLRDTKESAYYWRSIESTPEGLVPAMNGQLTEIDAAIVMLELCKQETEILLLPAPPQFESAADKYHSIDFVVIDPIADKTRGVQVKSYIDRFEDRSKIYEAPQQFKAIRKYDPDYVTMVDGLIDLGNSKMQYSERWGYTMVPDPGLISLVYLHGSANPDIARATGHIQDRILHDLQK
jgi:hypothetical protein